MEKSDMYNKSGCPDPVAFEVMRREEAETRRFNKLLRTIFSLCEIAGFRVEGRIELRDLRTNKLWK